MTIVPDKDFRVTLVNPDGTPCVPLDPSDPASWPSWCDNHYWEISDPDEVAELQALEHDRLEELADAATPSERLLATLAVESALPPISGGAPYEPTEEDWNDAREMFDRPAARGDGLIPLHVVEGLDLPGHPA
jgi:hypothetical protein